MDDAGSFLHHWDHVSFILTIGQTEIYQQQLCVNHLSGVFEVAQSVANRVLRLRTN